ncbi:MAG: hybrid sensor histidine kinase/response regulator, partial [Thiovulaceae bacterium]|nr:hybrid sensor histidine kinase/response regulator [Sulfurimonadaceae bacterium]
MTQDITFQDQHILIVDDNKSNILVLKLILQEHKVHHIYEATSATQAYALVEEHDVDAILLDVSMPDIDGIQACKHLRENPKNDLIPILMITAHKDNETLRKSFDAGANDFLEKPVNEIALMGRLKAQLKQRLMEQSIIKSSRFSAKDEMISMLSHQWRQPLSNITILTSTVRTMVELDSFEKNKLFESLSSIENAVINLSELLSSFSMALTSQRDKDETDLNVIIDNLLILMQTMLHDHAIELKRKTNINEKLHLDSQSLLQVLINIMTNSIEALQHDNIEHPIISIETSLAANILTLKIIDNGKGIKKEVLPFIFEPYYT